MKTIVFGIYSTTPITAGDFDGDGDTDLAIANRATAQMSVYINAGDGTFAAAVNYAGLGVEKSITNVDINGDGNLDIIVFDQNEYVIRYLGNGDGTFGAAALLVDDPDDPGSPNLANGTIGDFNGDGYLDLAIINRWPQAEQEIDIMFNDGDGTFSVGDTRYDIGNAGSGADFPESIVATDLNGDGVLDLVVTIVSTNGDATQIAVLMGNPNDPTNACSLSSGAWYCPVVLANSSSGTMSTTVTAPDGYVGGSYAPAALTNRSANTAAQIATTVPGVQYSHKLTLTSATAHGGFAVTGATVTNNLVAGGDAEVFTENGTTGVYYAAIPIANDNDTITISKGGWTTNIATTSGNRAASTDAQQAQTNTTLVYTALADFFLSSGNLEPTIARFIWIASSDTANFSEYEIYYRTSAGVTNANGTLFDQANDATLGTRATKAAAVTDLSCATANYYFVLYALDSKGNRTTAATELRRGTSSCPTSSLGGAGPATSTSTSTSTPEPTPTPTPAVPTTTTGEVTATAADGGKTTVTTTDSVTASVELPAAAVSASTTVSIAPEVVATATASRPVPAGQSVIGSNVYNYVASSGGTAVTTFSQAVTLTFTYTDAQVAGLNINSLKVHYYDETAKIWVALSTVVNTVAKTVTATTTHFTYFGIFGEPISEVSLVDTTGATLVDGDLIKTDTSYDIFIVKLIPSTGSGQADKKFKRLILNPDIFNSYGHLKWSNVKSVSQTVMDAFTSADLVIEVNADGTVYDPKVYKISSAPDSDVGQRQWLNMTAAQFEAEGYDWDAIYHINHIEAGVNFYPLGTAITSIK